jgi:hypothetical protein
MSSHFKYEIDERNLRLQLKENEFSFSEEAWQKFENYSASQKHTSNDAIIKRFQLSLNRNVVLPVVFASVIIMFSLLLFNFINIKNPNKESVNAAQTVKASVETPEVTKPVTPPTQMATAAVVKDTVAKEFTPAQVTAEVPEKTEAEATIARTAVIKATPVESTRRERLERENDTAKQAEVSSDNTTNVSSTPSEEVTVKKKRRNKRENIVTEPTQEEADQSPPPVSEETPQ